MATAAPALVEAAGGVVWRETKRGLEVLVVHRPKYDDWSLPKGRREPGESGAEAAEREVLEETGLECRLGDAIADVTYRDRKGRARRVRYWAMKAKRGRFAPNDEVDAVRWLPVTRAAELLTHDREVDVVRTFARSMRASA
jgi:8-oxo-dGTP pyrophosphatase MutT (NUDIX family)